MATGLHPDYERRARFWLRAFPRRYRTARADEVLSTLADLTEPGATRPDARTAADLVRAGWRERWRTRPPLWRWLTYIWTKKLPPAYHPWMFDDLDGPWWPVRNGLRGGMWIWLMILFDLLWSPSVGWWRVFAPIGVGLVVISAIVRQRGRRAVLLANGLDPDGRPLPPPPPRAPEFTQLADGRLVLTPRVRRLVTRPAYHGLASLAIITFAIGLSGSGVTDGVLALSAGRSRRAPLLVAPPITGATVLLVALAVFALLATPRIERRLLDGAYRPDVLVEFGNGWPPVGALVASLVILSGAFHSLVVTLTPLGGLSPALGLLTWRMIVAGRELGRPVPLPFAWKAKRPANLLPPA